MFSCGFVRATVYLIPLSPAGVKYIIPFNLLLTELAKREGGNADSHRAIQLSNVGYFSGYYDSATAKRVLDWLGATHPIFGEAHARGTLMNEDAFNAGVAIGEKHRAAPEGSKP
jgi:hypothetical protein